MNHCFISLITGYCKSLTFLVLLFVIEYCDDNPSTLCDDCSLIIVISGTNER